VNGGGERKYARSSGGKRQDERYTAFRIIKTACADVTRPSYEPQAVPYASQVRPDASYVRPDTLHVRPECP